MLHKDRLGVVQRAGALASSAIDRCPCCHGKCKCARHAHEHPIKKRFSRDCEFTAHCPCPMEMPVPARG